MTNTSLTTQETDKHLSMLYRPSDDYGDVTPPVEINGVKVNLTWEMVTALMYVQHERRLADKYGSYYAPEVLNGLIRFIEDNAVDFLRSFAAGYMNFDQASTYKTQDDDAPLSIHTIPYYNFSSIASTTKFWDEKQGKRVLARHHVLDSLPTVESKLWDDTDAGKLHDQDIADLYSACAQEYNLSSFPITEV